MESPAGTAEFQRKGVETQGFFDGTRCKFEFSAKTIQPVAKMLREELKKL